MSERKHGDQGREKKVAIQTKREEEQRPDKKPADSLLRLRAGAATQGDITALQNSVGNRVVRRLVQTSRNLVQRSFRDDSGYAAWRGQMAGHLRAIAPMLTESQNQQAGASESMGNAQGEWNSMHGTWHEATITSGADGETQAPPASEDIYEGETIPPSQGNITLGG